MRRVTCYPFPYLQTEGAREMGSLFAHCLQLACDLLETTRTTKGGWCEFGCVFIL